MATMTTLSKPRAARFLQMEFSLCAMSSDFAIALDATTRAIRHAELEIGQPKALSRAVEDYAGGRLDISSMSIAQRNACLASLVREVATEHGWLAGWKCLAEACPDSGIHDTLIKDVCIGVEVYNRIDVSSQPRSCIDLQFSVVPSPKPDSINETGLKTIGGHNWKSDNVYKGVVAQWMTPKDLVMGPCPLFGWMGQCKKVESLKDASTANYYWTAQLLGIVDYDLDKDDSNIPGGIKNAIERTAQTAVKMEGRMRGLGWNGLMTVDQQLFTRHKQVGWVREGKGSRSLGPSNISPQDFAIACYIDCAALAPFACHSATDLLQSRKSMFGAVVLANLHDLVFDMGYSSRISGAAYADATGAFEYDLPQAFLIGLMDALANRTLQAPPDQPALYGDNAFFATAMWSIFNVRYRAWERFVKYTRLLRRSESEKAARILQRAEAGMILVPDDLNQDLGDAWEMAVTPRTASKLTPRKDHTRVYVVSNPVHNLVPPELCLQCSASFKVAFRRDRDEVQSIHGLPESVTDCVPIALAVAIRRAALWATTSQCCDSCSCIVGTWANTMSDKVIVALMISEREVSLRDWLLQNYFVGCVAFSPLRLITILTGFDLVADIKYDTSALGERDNADC